MSGNVEPVDMRGMRGMRPVAVIGTATPSADQYAAARAAATGISRLGLPIICGGLGGVMEAACRGAGEGGGLAIAVLPHMDADQANPYAAIVLTTDLGARDGAIAEGRPDYSRNRIITAAALCAVAIGGGPGTQNEIKLALEFGKHVFGLAGSPDPEDAETLDPGRVARLYVRVADPDEAVERVRALHLADGDGA